MLRILITILLLFSILTNTAYSQELKLTVANEIEFLDKLSEKKEATVYDAFTLFYLLKYEKRSDFMTIRKELVKLHIIDNSEYKNEKEILRRGTLALLIAHELKTKDSLLYHFIKTERYAYQVCIANQIMPPGKSSSDYISGEQLISYLQILYTREDLN